MTLRSHRALACALFTSLLVSLSLAAAATAQEADTPIVEETIEVTATRVPEDPLEVPAALTIISGEELAARHATTLSEALSLVAGVSVAPGGDGGPASSVPELLGLRELDAFLLVVDDVPWGGAFNPALASLDVTNVERIEVLRGAAPVLYGATSFVGVIHVIHRAPGATGREVHLSAGRFGSYGGAVTADLPSGGSYRHSLTVNGGTAGFRDERTEVDRAHLLYRGQADFGGGRFRLDLDASLVDQSPASPHPREGRALSPRVPLDANHNPRDARLDEDRFHLVTGYLHPAAGGTWSTTLALTRTRRDTIRGFLGEELEVSGGQVEAHGFRQDFEGTDLYFDSHLAWSPAPALSLVAGIDHLFGKGKAESERFTYAVPLDGSNPPSSTGIALDERPELDDERNFSGLYLQTLWTPAPRWRVEAGARLNHTVEKQEGEAEGIGGDERVEDERTVTRASGSLGVSFRAWESQGDELWLFADYRSSFKPAAIDFGPEAEGEILDPETAGAVEVGIKGQHGGGRITWQASAFRMDFDNLVVAQTVNGLPALVNAGEERFEGFEIEGRFRLRPKLLFEAAYSYHDARFRDYVRNFDGVPFQLRGNRLELSPNDLASLGALWAPASGLNANVLVSYVGERYLNKRNTAVAGDFTTWSAGVGYRFAWGELRLDGWNLNDTRPPVAESELGDAQYYLLPARSYTASLRTGF